MSCCGLPGFRRFWKKKKRQPRVPSVGEMSEPSDADAETSTTDPAHLYGPLKRHEIRLLSFRSLHSTDPMELRLQTVSLGARPYQALSYAWGGETGIRQSIRVNGCAVDVTVNLFEALEAMRRILRRSKSRTGDACFWVDAICIDQGFAREKSQQVRLMGKIYTKAANVLIWLGPADQDSNSAIRFFERWGRLLSRNQELQAVLQRGTPQVDADADASDRLSASIMGDVDRAGREGYLGLERLQAVGRFSNRSYWGRTWTLQEQVLAKRATIVCGKRSLSASTFWSVGVVLFHLGTRYHFPEAHLTAMLAGAFPCLRLRLGRIRGSEAARDPYLDLLDSCLGQVSLAPEYLQGGGGENPFLRLVLDHSHALASTDPRDRIYGLLGLAADSQRPVEPDYSLDACQVYTTYWTAELQKPHGVEALGIVTATTESSPIPHLPSWVPDFRGRLQEWVEWHSPDDWHSKRRLKDGLAPSMRWSADGRELTVQGFLFDRIEGVCDFYAHAKPAEQIMKCIEFILDSYLADPYSIRQADCPWTVALFHSYVVGRRNNDVDAELILTDPAIRDEVLLFYNVLAEWAISSKFGQGRAMSFLMSPEAAYDGSLLPAQNKRDQQDKLGRLLLRQVATALDVDPLLVETLAPATETEHKLIAKAARNWQDRRRLLLSRDGYIGSIEVEARKGDVVCLVPGCPRALVLRPRRDGSNKFRLIGRAIFPFMSLQTEYLAEIEDICLV